MMSLTEQLSRYYQAHQHPINKLCHYIGITAVLFSLLIFFSWIHIVVPHVFDIHLSWLLMTALLIYYFRLDISLALVMTIILILLTFLATLLSHFWISYFLFLILFIMGWSLKLIGHLIENKKPSFINNPVLILIAPLFLLTELAFLKGYKKNLKENIRFF